MTTLLQLISSELARGTKLVITLEESLLILRPSLNEYGFKVLSFKKDMKEEDLFSFLEGTILVTKECNYFKKFAVIYDFDIACIKNIGHIDNNITRNNTTLN